MDIETIYTDYHEKVLYFIRCKVNSVDDAEDICSDVFMKVQNKFSDFDSEKASLSTWIFTIARNTVIDFYRKTRVTEEIPEDLSSDFEVDSGLLNRETLSALADALEKLSDEERTVIVLHYYEGLSLKDIEENTGLSYGQVKLRHNSALKKMNIFFIKTARGGFSLV
ncbi:MAG: sigma-70 family RNA polymerase sigma factor [Lachnospiraceae bacterium]|nr:sigma-70 family RNA polymerase sigma factor [Lachnospiraceae bacterium]